MTDLLTPAQLEARRQGKLDQRCRDCGTTSAASSWCCGCGGRNLEYRAHVAGETQWCRQDNRPKKAVDPDRQARGRAAAVAKEARKRSGSTPDTPATETPETNRLS